MRTGFTAIDVETANADMASICQIGIACYTEGVLSSEWKTYIDPEDYFDPVNISIHGIDEASVRGAPIVPDVSGTIYKLLDEGVAVCHTHFDRVAVPRALDKYRLRHPTCVWLDSARVARRAWGQFARCGYGLTNVCEFLGYKFTPHDALEDAKAAAHILNAAITETGLDIEDWLARIKQPISRASSRPWRDSTITREGNPEGPLHGEVVVFTGALEIPRREAADIAAQVGWRVAENVTKKTTLLVVGDQDVKKLAGHERSSKHRRAEALISKGQPIRILRETDFRQIAELMD